MIQSFFSERSLLSTPLVVLRTVMGCCFEKSLSMKSNTNQVCQLPRDVNINIYSTILHYSTDTRKDAHCIAALWASRCQSLSYIFPFIFLTVLFPACIVFCLILINFNLHWLLTISSYWFSNNGNKSEASSLTESITINKNYYFCVVSSRQTICHKLY